MRARLVTFVLAGLLLLQASLARAADYYVRPDGNDANPGTADTAAGAFGSVGKCAQTAQAGDRCLIAPGQYQETNAVQANAGSLVGTALATCDCAHGSSAISCRAAVPASIAAGTFVRCSGAHGFSWSRVASASGKAIALAEPYRGATLSGAPLDVARFVEILGQGATPRDVLITEFRPQPSWVSWQKDASHDCVWRYEKASAVVSAWKMPTGFREDVPDSDWNLYVEQKNGRDLYFKTWATGEAPAGSMGDCPCQSGALPDQVQSLPGSWGDDGTFIYLHPRACVAPDTVPIVAGRHGSGGEGGATLQSLQPFSVVDNLAVDVGGFDYAGKSSLALGLVLGASNARYSNLEQEGGRLSLAAPAGSTDTLYEHVRTLEGGQCALSTGHSGLELYDVEIRGGAPVGLSCATISGAGADDPIVFERVYVHRTFPPLAGNAACELSFGATTWDCVGAGFASCPDCENQDPRLLAGTAVSIGDAVNDNATDHLVVRNSVVELARDGWGIFNGSAGGDVWFVNNTFGLAHRTDDGLKALVGSSGASGGWGANLYNNLFVLGSATAGGIRYQGTRGDLVSDYNLFLAFNAAGATQVWNAGDTLELVVSNDGQETHSVLVCSSGCAATDGTYFNDQGESGLVHASLLDGAPADYTPTPSFRGLDLGDNAHCPAEDFLGQPRSDGKCDIGAIEYHLPPPGLDAGPGLDAAEGLDAALGGADAQPVAGFDAGMAADASQVTGLSDAQSEGVDASPNAGDAAMAPADAAGRADASAASSSSGCGCTSASGASEILLALVMALGTFCRRRRT